MLNTLENFNEYVGVYIVGCKTTYYDKAMRSNKFQGNLSSR